MSSLYYNPRLVVDDMKSSRLEGPALAAGRSGYCGRNWTTHRVFNPLVGYTRASAPKRPAILQGNLPRQSGRNVWGDGSSIAHEVNSRSARSSAMPISAWLAASVTPDLVQVRDALCDIIRDGHRASEVLTRIRSSSGKSRGRRLPQPQEVVASDSLASHEVKERISECGMNSPLTPACVR